MAERARPVVAELGRPETPEETAYRKAKASADHRKNQTARNLVGSLIAVLVVVAAIYFAVPRSDENVRPPVDYTAASIETRQAVDDAVAAPVVPPTWQSNRADLERDGAGVLTWYAGFVIDEGEGLKYAALEQAFNGNDTWLRDRTGGVSPGQTISLGGLDWVVYDNRDAPTDEQGNSPYLLAHTEGDMSVLVFGTTDPLQIDAFADSAARSLLEDRPSND